MEWQTKIGSCFEEPKFVFAGKSTTENNAFELLSQLRENDITWKETAIHFAQYLLNKGCDAQQVDEQIFRIQQRYFYWLK